MLRIRIALDELLDGYVLSLVVSKAKIRSRALKFIFRLFIAAFDLSLCSIASSSRFDAKL